MPIARFEMPDGRIGRFEVPEGTTPEQAQALIADSLKQENTAPSAPTKQANMGMLGNLGMGALKGATNIGSTINSALLSLGDWQRKKGLDLGSLLTGVPDQPIINPATRHELSQFFKENADPESIAFKGGELGTEIAGTAGAGGIAAKGLKAIPAVANAAPKLISALETGGFKLGAPAATTKLGMLGDAGLRATGGAVTSGLSSAMIDPETAGTGAAIGAVIPGGAKLAGMAGSGAKKLVGTVMRKSLGLATGAGDEAIAAAVKAGKEGNTTFLDNLRGKVDMTDVLDNAKAALSQMRIDRGAEYRAGMAGVSKDKTILDVKPIQSAISNIRSMGSFKGQQINKNASGVVDDIARKVDEWVNLNPAEYHTPEGLDALKQAIGDIRDATQFGTPGRKAADTAYNAVKKQITDQAPEYSKVMKDYSEASEIIGEIQKAMSLGEKASKDTSMRKLQSLMRNNVNTNYGNRLDLARELEQKGGRELLPAIAGQALSSATPRGLQGLAASGTGVAGISNPAFLAALPFQSPRLMGEAAYKLGQGSGLLGNAASSVGRAATNNLGLLGRPEAYLPAMTIAPSVVFSQ